MQPPDQERLSTTPKQPRKLPRLKLPARFSAVSWRDLAATLGPMVVLSAAAIWLTFTYVRPAPPNTLIITSGPPNSTFRATAERYKAILARDRVKLEILDSEGSLENLKRLTNRSVRVDVGFVQGGISSGMKIDGLVSLGSVFNQPLAVFYRGPKPIDQLWQLTGKRLAIGHEGSGTRFLALSLLKANGIEAGGATQLLPLGGEEAAEALTSGAVDAVFLQSDSAGTAILRRLTRTPGVQLMSFSQADAYTRRFRHLNKLELPMGSIDFAQNIPRQAVALIGPTTELIARDDLHPALSDLLIEAAREVHGGANLLQRAGEFPAPLEHEFRISDDALRYYKSGKGFLYRYLPFWIASLADRLVVLLVPLLVLVIPGMRIVPALYRWRVMSRIYKCYGALLGLERDTFSKSDTANREALLARLDAIEQNVAKLKVPLAYADQFYVLRQHIDFVRERLTQV